MQSLDPCNLFLSALILPSGAKQNKAFFILPTIVLKYLKETLSSTLLFWPAVNIYFLKHSF